MIFAYEFVEWWGAGVVIWYWLTGVCVCVFVANLPVSPSVKEFWKSLNILGSYEEEFSVLFFVTLGVVAVVVVVVVAAAAAAMCLCRIHLITTWWRSMTPLHLSRLTWVLSSTCFYCSRMVISGLAVMEIYRKQNDKFQYSWVVWCWHGYLSGARCRLAYGPADATSTHCLLLQ